MTQAEKWEKKQQWDSSNMSSLPAFKKIFKIWKSSIEPGISVDDQVPVKFVDLILFKYVVKDLDFWSS